MSECWWKKACAHFLLTPIVLAWIWRVPTSPNYALLSSSPRCCRAGYRGLIALDSRRFWAYYRSWEGHVSTRIVKIHVSFSYVKVLKIRCDPGHHCGHLRLFQRQARRGCWDLQNQLLRTGPCGSLRSTHLGQACQYRHPASLCSDWDHPQCLLIRVTGAYLWRCWCLQSVVAFLPTPTTFTFSNNFLPRN